MYKRQGYINYKGHQSPFETEAELSAAIEKCTITDIEFLWSPESDKLILLEESAHLLPLIKPQRIKNERLNLAEAKRKLLISTIVLVGITWLEFKKFGPQFTQSFIFSLASVGFIAFCLLPFYEACRALKKAKSLSAQDLQDEAKDNRFYLWVKKQPFYFTIAIASILVIIAVLQFFTKSQNLNGFQYTVELAGLNKALIGNGEGWRFWSAPLLHGNIVHLILNLSGILYIGRRVENLAKWPHLILTSVSYTHLTLPTTSRV